LDNLITHLRTKKAYSLISDVPVKERILDIGCGVYPLFLKGCNFREKYGLDKTIDSDNAQNFINDSIFVANYDIEKNVLPYKSNYFNAVTMLAVFEHIEPKRLIQLLTEIRRVLVPGGQYIMTTPAAWTDKLLKTMAKLHLASSIEIYDHKDVYTPSKISAILQQANFQEDNIKSGYFELFMNIWITAKKDS